MTTTALSAGKPQLQRSLAHPAAERWLVAVGLLLFSLAARWPFLGHPDLHIDEHFYLIVGDRMLHGAVPYVDIWDRKPVGLFFIFAAIRLLGGDGILQYQLVASAFAAFTAYVLWLVCRRTSGQVIALGAAGCYILWLAALSGAGGQSPVFYNLFTAVSALLALRAADRASVRSIRRAGLPIMIICGLVLQIKYTSVCEGAFFGLFLLWLQWRAEPRLLSLAGSAALYVTVALLPTAAVTAWYAVNGHFDVFFHANFVSIFERASQPTAHLMRTVRMLLFILNPLLLCVIVGTFLTLKDRATFARPETVFLLGWTASASLGFVLIGNFFHHYALPLLVPYLWMTARTFENRKTGPFLLLALAAWATFVSSVRHPPKSESKAMIDAMSARIRPYAGDRCMFIYDGPLILYRTTGACMPWRYPFPLHLQDFTEHAAVGTDTRAEMAKILAARPGVILTASATYTAVVDEVNERQVAAVLKQEYQAIGEYGRPERRYTIYVLRSLIGRN